LCYEVEENCVDSEGRFVWVKGEAVCNFGKHEGRPLREVAALYHDYMEWIIRKDFSVEVKEIARKAMQGEFPKPDEPSQPTVNDM
jgi:hypothetical protein